MQSKCKVQSDQWVVNAEDAVFCVFRPSALTALYSLLTTHNSLLVHPAWYYMIKERMFSGKIKTKSMQDQARFTNRFMAGVLVVLSTSIFVLSPKGDPDGFNVEPVRFSVEPGAISA